MLLPLTLISLNPTLPQEPALPIPFVTAYPNGCLNPYQNCHLSSWKRQQSVIRLRQQFTRSKVQLPRIGVMEILRM